MTRARHTTPIGNRISARGAVSPDLAEAADREVGADDETIVEEEGLSNRYAGERMTTARDFIDQELGAKGYPARQP